MSSKRDNESRYSKSTTRTVRTARTSATNASETSHTSGASISSEQRSKEFLRQKERDGGRNGGRDRESDRYRTPSKTSSSAPSKAPSITPSQSISVCAPPKSRSLDIRSRRGSSAASSATVKPSYRKASSEAPSIRSNLLIVPEDKTVIEDSNSGYRRSANPSEAGKSTSGSRTYTHDSRHTSKKYPSIYNPAASRAPTELSHIHRSMGSVANSVMDHMERKAGRDLGNTLLLDGDGGLFELSRADEGGKRLLDRRQRRGDSPGRSSYSDVRSDSGRRTVVPADYQFSERGSEVSDIRSNSGRRTLVPAGYEFSDRGSAVSGHSSRKRTSVAPPSSASSRPNYTTKEVGPDGY
ncbi:hypothetical protein EAF04_004480 [Stromatinia cepivora]|nr:hypothetical protein EAF04_004480 [Stromatinia cepivora]